MAAHPMVPMELRINQAVTIQDYDGHIRAGIVTARTETTALVAIGSRKYYATRHANGVWTIQHVGRILPTEGGAS